MRSTLISVTNPRGGPHTRQRGSIVVITTIGMVALLALAGLALDGGHMLLNKTRLQNTVDAAVLSAGKSLSLGEDVTTATTDAIATFVLNANATGNHEMADAYAAGKISVIVEYSDSINPFTPDATLTDPAFVRVSVNSFPLPVWLSQIVGFTDKRVRASAVAGESPTLQAEACDIAPIMACGDPLDPPTPYDPTDTSYYGYETGKTVVLKLAGGSDPTVGPGNFQILAPYDPGGATYRDLAAGGSEGCIVVTDDSSTDPGTAILSEPGAKSGPTSQGFNTRLNIYAGPVSPSEYPPDNNIHYVKAQNGNEGIIDDVVVTSAATYSYDKQGALIDPADIYTYNEYKYDSKHGSCPGGCTGTAPNNRRVLTLPIGNCDGTTAGRDYVQIMAFGCFFMIQKVDPGNNDLFGEFIDVCEAEGGFLQNPTGTGTGPTRLILYKDSASGDS